jgi:cytochrome c oxidase cbb3-type subunit 1
MNSPDNNARSEQQAIDASTKWPVIAFFGAALVWLLAGGALELIASIQLHTPAFLADCEWFTHGRVAPAAQNALVYGWGCNAGFAFALWLMARLSAAALRSGGTLDGSAGGWLLVAAAFWNLGVALGVIGILTGASTSYELLEMPRFVTLLLFGAYLFIGVWAVTTYSVRNTENVYASQWYILGAAFWFPWLFIAATRMLFASPVNGTVQSIVNAWYVNGLYSLWFVPLALAAIYYFLPKILGKPIYDYYIAIIAFWWLALTTSLAAGSRLIGGPVPAWVGTLGVVANFLAVPAIVMIGVNFLGTLSGRFSDANRSLTLRFMLLSILGFFAASALNLLLSFRGVVAVVQFTVLFELRDWALLYACFSTAMFGAAYFYLPRVTGKAWRSPALIKAHYLATAVGMVALVAGLAYTGWHQGELLNTATLPFAEITKAMTPWFAFRTIALMLLTIGHAAFFINFAWIACPVSSLSTPVAVFRNPPALEGQKA